MKENSVVFMKSQTNSILSNFFPIDSGVHLWQRLKYFQKQAIVDYRSIIKTDVKFEFKRNYSSGYERGLRCLVAG